MTTAVKELPTSSPPEPLASDLCWLLSRVSHALMTEMTAALEDSGMSPRARSVLATAMTGEYTQTELARIIGLDKTTMVVTVDELEASGLAERRPAIGDRRARVIAVTKAGERKVKDAEVVLERVREDVLCTLPASERQTFLRALGRLACDRVVERSGAEADRLGQEDVDVEHILLALLNEPDGVAARILRETTFSPGPELRRLLMTAAARALDDGREAVTASDILLALTRDAD